MGELGEGVCTNCLKLFMLSWQSYLLLICILLSAKPWHMLQCAKSVLLNKIVSSDKDLVSIVFFGTVS